MDAHELRLKLTDRLEDLCQYLLPGGGRHGNYWHAGDVAGSEGDSLRVCLTGAKRGCWLDGAGDGKGGPIDLWMAHYGHSSIKDALPGIREWLGVKEAPRISRQKKEYKEIDDSEINRVKVNSKIYEYLKNDRGLNSDILTSWNVSQSTDDREIVFPYFDEENVLRMVKFISLKRVNGKKKVHCSAGSKPILYGMNSERLKKGGTLVISEGEIDRLSWESQGIGAVSVPFGAKGEDEHGKSPNDEWIDNCWQWLEQFHTIYVAMDSDEEGQRAALAIIKRLGSERCLNVLFPSTEDANSLHCSRAQLTDYLATARPISPDGVVVASEMDDEVWEELEKGPREGQGHLLFDWAFKSGQQFRVRQREGTIITGFAGHGKSSWLYQLAAWLAVVKGERVFIGSYEEPARTILGIMAVQVLGRKFQKGEKELFKIIKEELLQNIVIHAVEGTVSHKKFFELARYSAKRHGTKHDILDSLSCLDLNLDENDDVKKFAQEWQKHWKETGNHSWVVGHPRKGLNEKIIPGKQDIKGSGILGDLTFNVITIHRFSNEDDEDESKGDPCKGFFKCDKQKVGGQKPKQTIFYNPESLRYTLKRESHAEPWIEEIRLKGIPT